MIYLTLLIAYLRMSCFFVLFLTVLVLKLVIASEIKRHKIDLYLEKEILTRTLVMT